MAPHDTNDVALWVDEHPGYVAIVVALAAMVVGAFGRDVAVLLAGILMVAFVAIQMKKDLDKHDSLAPGTMR